MFAMLLLLIGTIFVATQFKTDDSTKELHEPTLQTDKNNKKAVQENLEYKARHILLKSEKEAKSLIDKLNKGANFIKLAKLYSVGPSGSGGGDLGWFKLNQMVPPFSDAVTALQNGKYTESPVETQFGWHVILREDARLTSYGSFTTAEKTEIKSGKVFQDTLKDGSKGPEMVEIPKGKFRMGDIQGNGNEDEKPVHKVNIKYLFALSKNPVTFDDYAVFVKDKDKKQPDDEGWGRGNRPVINVSWEDATAYVKWLGDQTGKIYRLPSEAEWEYAARADTKTAYWWGDEIGVNNTNSYGSGSKWSGRKTSPVDAFKANSFGLHDMSGNIWEWVQDTWHENYQGAPEDGSVWKGGDTTLRVLRGGSWYGRPALVRSAFRFWSFPGSRTSGIGFRLAQDL